MRGVRIRSGLQLQFADELMGQAGRLGQAVLGCAGKGDSDSIFKQALVADGDEDRLDIGAGSEHGADGFIARGLLLVVRPAFCA